MTEQGGGVIHVTVYGAAAPAGSKVAGVTKSGRRFVRDASQGSAAWKRAVAQVAGEEFGDRPPLAGPLQLTLHFFVQRPLSHLRKSGELTRSAPLYPAKRPDLLKLARAVEDGLTGIAYFDDSQIVSEHLEKHYGNPTRVEISLSAIEAGVQEAAA